MIINGASLNALRAGFTNLYNDSYEKAPLFWDKVAMQVNSKGAEQKYGWLGLIPDFREWLGDRVVQNLAAFDFTLKNKSYELTIGVGRDEIEDDNIGQYGPIFSSMGDAAKRHPDRLIFSLLLLGFSTLCYDGQFFFDTDHPVLDANGAVQSQSNSGGGSGAAWFLMDTTKPIKPLIWQKRRDYEFVALDNPDDTEVFKKKQFQYGVDGRGNAGLGLWQLAYGSKQTLDETNYEAARANISGRLGDYGRPLALTPNLLVVGSSNEKKALDLVKADRKANGATNTFAGTADVLVVPYLP